MKNKEKILEAILDTEKSYEECLEGSNVIKDSQVSNNITNQFKSIKEEYNKLREDLKIKKHEVEMLDDDDQAHPGFDWQINNEQIDGHKMDALYAILQKNNHPLVEKIEALNSLLEDNKKQTDKLYEFFKEAKSSNNGQEFKNEEEFKKFLNTKGNDLSRLSLTKDLMNISNAFIKMDPEPKDFNGFVDKSPTVEPNTEQKHFILKLIDKILTKLRDKLSTKSQAKKIGKSMMKDLNKAIKQSESQKKDQGHSRNM